MPAFSRARLLGLLKTLRPVFKPDYSSSQAFFPYIGLLGPFNFLVLHFVEAGKGYRDWLPLRILCILCLFGLFFLPRHRRLKRREIAYFEFTGWLTLPVAQTFLFLLNKPDPYWISSFIMIGIVIGLVSKPVWFFPHLISGISGGIGLYTLLHGAPGPEAVKQVVNLLPNAILPGLVSSTVQWGLHAFQQRGIALAEARAKASEALAANEELRRREKVIMRFVRPSLCMELAQGNDPVEFIPVEKDLAVLFCDIRDFTALTEVLEPREKQSFLNGYFSLMTHPIAKHGGEVDKIMGDCVMGLFPDGNQAIKAAIEMRRDLQAYNAGLHAQGRPKIRNGIGIAKGPVLLGNFGSHEKLDRTVIGEAVNIASRLESKTKMYNLEVVVTEDVIKDLDPGEAHWRWIDIVRVKGSSRHLRLFEVYSHQPPAVRDYKNATKGLLEKALDIYFRKGFRDASRLLQAMQEKVPPHLHQSNQLMDNLIAYYLERCRAWIQDDPGAWERIQKWEGVHVFLEK